MRKFFNAYRIASCLLVFYTIGHTLGAVIDTPKFGAEADSVADLMKSVHVQTQGFDCTWYGFYRGFGIFVSLFFALSAVMTWIVGGMSTVKRRTVLPLMWALFASYATSVIVTLSYFFLVPALFSSAITLALGVGCFRDQTATLPKEA